MKLVTFKPAEPRPGALIDEDVLDFRSAAGSGVGTFDHATIVALLAAGEQAMADAQAIVDQVRGDQALAASLRDAGALLALADTRLLAPVPEPKLVICAASNYRSHSAEMGTAPPSEPACFIKATTSVTAHAEPIVLPPEAPAMVDYEGELCVIIGKTAYRVSEADAMRHVAGYVCGNDVSARDWVPALRKAGADPAGHPYPPFLDPGTLNIRFKSFPTFMPTGPALVTADEVPDPHALRIRTLINGEALQDSNTDDLTFNIPQLIAHYSKFFRFEPGDMICTGSPPGVGIARNPQVFLKPGDVVSVEIEGIGTLTNPVIGYEG